MRARRYAAAVVVPLTLLALSGCGDDGPDPDGPTDSSSTADGLTPPGTTLAIGDTATVPSADGTGVLELTVTGIEEGTFSDLEDYDDQGTGPVTPYYVSYDFTLISGNADGITMRDYLSAWADDEQAGTLVSSDRFPRCQEANFPSQAVPVGTAVSSCKTYLVDEGGAPVDNVRFDNEDGYQMGDGNQVEWE